MAGERQLTVEQLAGETGMSVRNIRNHQSRGLLPPPEVRARIGYYGDDHVVRLRLIQEMQAQGFKLSAIKRLVGVVLVVMIGGTALTFQDLGWLPAHPTPFTLPTWMGAWFEMYSTWETLGVQFVAALLVIGSYYAAEYVKVKRPVKQGREPARRATDVPAVSSPQPGV